MAMQNNRKLQVNAGTMSHVKTWVGGRSELAFFSALFLSIPFHFKTEEYMKGRFGSTGAVVTDANQVFLGEDFLLTITFKQTVYLCMHMLMQIAHLHLHRCMPLTRDETTPFPTVDRDVRAACGSLAATLMVNEELANTDVLKNYYDVMAACDHVLLLTSPDNYWKHLGWEKIEDVPTPIRDVEALKATTVERITSLFIQHHNPNNPPRMPKPLWGEATEKELNGQTKEAMKNQAKNLVKRAAYAAKEAGSNCFCPFEVDDLHMVQSVRVNYKHYLDLMVADSNSDWQGYDRRDLNNVDYMYSMENQQLTCVVYCDTSGSLLSDVKEVLSETLGIIKSQNSKVRIKYFASGVEQQEEEVWLDQTSEVADLNLPTSTGGTEWSPIAEDVAENHPQDNIIIITDGYFFDDITPLETSGKTLMVLSKTYNDSVDWQDAGFLVGYSDVID